MKTILMTTAAAVALMFGVTAGVAQTEPCPDGYYLASNGQCYPNASGVVIPFGFGFDRDGSRHHEEHEHHEHGHDNDHGYDNDHGDHH